MYISNEFLSWDSGYDSTGVDFEKLKRSHDIWRHAKERLNNNPTEFDKVDCITSLKRAINSRLKAISKEYSINELPNLRKKKQQLEKFQDYGLVRPAFLKALFDLRNILEHGDVTPPATEKCNYYIDIAWYFLKSTDSLLVMKNDNVFFEQGDDYDDDASNGISIGYKIKDGWEIGIGGCLEDSLISSTEVKGWIYLPDFKVIEGRAASGFVCFRSSTPALSEESLISLARIYFSSMGYWYSDHL
ncbi:hypothetical protein [Colwellia psychrerythraea]|uniref:DUF4145 domain-containing protein n=1 Tax=Colwellia psychrerythraea TaxID=28229 RepID=A0A099L3Z1_COLPS|nr:hypothetical protein [Colwellia psychrerythraea]KGJ97576.1 hypothetical protein GAB14E_1165 [Colwellia psychrerythraea]